MLRVLMKQNHPKVTVPKEISTAAEI